jgi:transcriptional regulator of acetoin/glycerol metabolism
LTPVVRSLTLVAVTTRTVIKPTPKQLRKALLKSGGSITQAAVELGVHRVTIHKWMREYGIEVQRIVA